MKDGLYEASDLLVDYKPGDPSTFVRSWDYKEFIRYTADGGPLPKSADIASKQAEHDANISLSLRNYLQKQTEENGSAPRLVAVMGGHSLDRDSAAYKLTADIGRDLAKCGFIVATGGGPGAMEAGHAGAYFAAASDDAYHAALAELAKSPKLPSDLGNILDPKTGTLNPGQEAAYKHASDWLNAALNAKACLAEGALPGVSIAVPTWFYGSEPTTPFATVYAKYYQNSIREETLVAEGKTGTIYARGSGGTLREIFQGVEHNCYVQTAADFLPMIFVDQSNYWQTTASYGKDGEAVIRGVNLADAIPPIFKVSLPAELWSQCRDKVQFTTDLTEIRRVLDAHAPNAEAKLRAMFQGEPVQMCSARFVARRSSNLAV